MIAVAGVSGHTGSAAAGRLLDRGRPTRVIVRDAAKGDPWKARGAEIAVASLGDADALAAALKGVGAAYLLIPPAYDAPDLLAAQRVVVDAIARAVQQSRVGHVVLLSSVGAHHAEGTGPIRILHHAEQRLRESGRPVTFLRAPYFVENWAGVLPAVTGQGVLPSLLPVDQPLEMATTADIGHAAADLLAGHAPAGVSIVEMGGPAPLSPRQLARDLARTLGRHVEPIQLPLDQVVPVFRGLGFSENAAELVREMYGAVYDGRLVFESPTAPHVRGQQAAADALAAISARM
jgi:uncharacterized protein YbjT (DUF2867 family)